MKTPPRAGPLSQSSLYMVEVRARDWPKLCEFYGVTLGLPLRMNDQASGFAMFGAREPFIAVVKKDPGPGPSRVVLDFSLQGLDGALEALAHSGVPVLSEPKASPEGYRIARIADPEGNEIHLFEWSQPSGAPG